MADRLKKLFHTIYTRIQIHVCIRHSFIQAATTEISFWEDPRMIPRPEVIKLFSCSTQLSMKFYPLINVKMPTIVGILTCISGKNTILGLNEPKKPNSMIFLYL